VSDKYLWDRGGPPDPEIVRLEQLLGTLRALDSPARLALTAETDHAGRPPASVHAMPARTTPAQTGRTGRWFLFPLAAAATITLAAIGVIWQASTHTNGSVAPAWSVARLTGAPRVGSRTMGEASHLAVGQWLETDGQARAQINVADIGRVHVDPGTRVRLVSTRSGEYRMQLAHGTLHALIWAPPGQFFVDTPSSTAIDLGCAYTLQVDPSGAGMVRVESGWVGFEWRGREAFIPAGAVCATRPGVGPGTPHYDDVFGSVRDALETLDFGHPTAAERAAALTRVLDNARTQDAVTLWHLLSRVEPGAERDRVFDRLAALVPPPADVTREGIGAGRRDMLDRWWERLGLGEADWWRMWKQPWRDQAAGESTRPESTITAPNRIEPAATAPIHADPSSTTPAHEPR
jgi:hypothetical protein